MSNNRRCIHQRVVQAAESALRDHHYVTPVDVFIGIGALQPTHVQDWKKGRIPYLEAVIQGSLGKISFAMNCLKAWACQKRLSPSQTAYLARTKSSKRDLQFSKSGNPYIEELYRTHYVSPLLKERKNQKRSEKTQLLTDRQSVNEQE